MTAKTKDEIKAFFQTGDTPTEAQFIDFIDSYVDKAGPLGTLETAASAGHSGVTTFLNGIPSISSYAAVRSSMDITVYNTALAVGAVAGSYVTTAQAETIADAQADSFGGQLLHVRDEKPNGTHGGDFVAGTWRTRTLNTVKTNEISGASLSSNQITLPAGTYFIIAKAPGYKCGNNRLRLYNLTNAVEVLVGRVTVSSVLGGVQSDAEVCGRFTITAQKTFEVQHYGAVTEATVGFGVAQFFGMVEVYAEVMIWKVS